MRWFSRPKFCFSRLKIHRYRTNGKKKLNLMLGFLFVDQRNSSEFRYEIVFRGIQPCFSRRAAWLVLNPTKAETFLKKLHGYILFSVAKESKFLKGNFCIYKGFMDVFYILTLTLKGNHKMCPDLKLIFMLNFAMCSADLTCVNGSMIQLVFC